MEISKMSDSQHILFQSPSYFAGDLRKLKVVSEEDLFLRGNQDQKNFFTSIRHALITSIKGTFAEAHKMSGGDYDGDRAWVSWNADLIACLPDREKFVHENTSDLFTNKSALEDKLFANCSEAEIFEYMMHFRYHHRTLGRLSELLDFYIDNIKYGFNHAHTKEIGRAAFLQVKNDLKYVFLSNPSNFFSFYSKVDLPFNPYHLYVLHNLNV